VLQWRAVLAAHPSGLVQVVRRAVSELVRQAEQPHDDADKRRALHALWELAVEPSHHEVFDERVLRVVVAELSLDASPPNTVATAAHVCWSLLGTQRTRHLMIAMQLVESLVTLVAALNDVDRVTARLGLPMVRTFSGVGFSGLTVVWNAAETRGLSRLPKSVQSMILSRGPIALLQHSSVSDVVTPPLRSLSLTYPDLEPRPCLGPNPVLSDMDRGGTLGAPAVHEAAPRRFGLSVCARSGPTLSPAAVRAGAGRQVATHARQPAASAAWARKAQAGFHSRRQSYAAAERGGVPGRLCLATAVQSRLLRSGWREGQ
jgi:hypothetical protein